MNGGVTHVAVLMGGWSAEREVSLVSGAACVKALKEAGYDVTPIDVQRDMGALMTRLYPKPHVVFNALHGRFGEDGCVQGLLDILEIPYTHSGLLASALAMDKPLAKRLFVDAGIPVAEHVITNQDEIMAGDPMPKPYVIKPLNEGSSVGVHIVTEDVDEGPVLSYCRFSTHDAELDPLWDTANGRAVDQIKEADGEQFPLFAGLRQKGLVRERPLLVETLKALADGRIEVDPERRTSLKGVWAGGDCVAGGKDLTVAAVEDGKVAARDIHRALSGAS